MSGNGTYVSYIGKMSVLASRKGHFWWHLFPFGNTCLGDILCQLPNKNVDVCSTNVSPGVQFPLTIAYTVLKFLEIFKFYKSEGFNTVLFYNFTINIYSECWKYRLLYYLKTVSNPATENDVISGRICNKLNKMAGIQALHTGIVWTYSVLFQKGLFH